MTIKGLLLVLFAYLLGSVPVGFWFGGLFFKKDIRKAGSGNIGATNTYRVLGSFAGMTVFFLDFAKGAVPLILLQLVTADRGLDFQISQVVIAFAAIIGHTYSVFLNFSGGKGVATVAGILTVISWQITLTLFIIWLAVVLSSRYISLGSLVIAVVLPFLAYFMKPGNVPFLVFSIMSAILVIYKHKLNIRRIIDGSEAKILERY